MIYRAELDFLRKMLKKFRLQSFVLAPGEALPEEFSPAFRKFFGRDSEYDRLFLAVASRAEEQVIYLVSDGVRCRYAFMKLPADDGLLMIGPYYTEVLREQDVAALSARFSLSAERAAQLRHLMAEVPVLAGEGILTRALQALGETVWGETEMIRILDIDREFEGVFSFAEEKIGATADEQLLLNMQLMETRYANENELMRIVSNGLVMQADQMMFHFSDFHFAQRSGDPLYSFKHYCIVCNTLLRKAAEQGGVHPLYLDRMSSDFAWKIESLRAVSEGESLIGDMIRTYSRLVRKHATAGYSGLVQKTVTYIDADPAGDLSLRTVAAAQKVTASYLSAQFKKETGQTLTDYVNEKRIHHAIHLLQTTRLQVQTIAQRCGFQDPNYFVRLFKKKTGVTPAQYRRHSGAERGETQK